MTSRLHNMLFVEVAVRIEKVTPYYEYKDSAFAVVL